MAERDAFGNEIDDRERAPAVAPAPAPAVSVGGAAPPAPPASDTPPPASFGSGGDPFGAMPTLPPPVPRAAPPGGIPTYRPPAGVRVVRTLVLTALPLAVIGAIGLAVFSIGNDVSDRVDDARRAISTSLDQITVPTVPPTETPAAPATPPTGFGKGSLLLKSNFADALRTLRNEGSRVKLLRVAPDRINAQLVTQQGALKSVQITWQGEVQRSTTADGFPTNDTFSLDALRRAAPFRLARSAAGREGRSPAAIDYAVTLKLGGRQMWTVLFKDRSAQYLADATGRITSKNG